MSEAKIRLRGVRVHNLKDIDLDLPRGNLIVVCGVSGSGKSSLALDTLYAEGQRRYIESFSPYTRQFLEQLDKPDAEHIEGIPPAIAVTRTVPQSSSRATVGSATELLDYLRLLWARIAQVVCPGCQRHIAQDSPESIVARILELPEGVRLMVSVPFSIVDTDDWTQTCDRLTQQGFVRGIANGKAIDLSGAPAPSSLPTDLHVVIDRLRTGSVSAERMTDSIESAYELGSGRCSLWVEATTNLPPLDSQVRELDGQNWYQLPFSRRLSCENCGIEFPEPEPRLFSYNSPLGACPTCEGFGSIQTRDIDLIVPDSSKTLKDGAIAPWGTPAYAHKQRSMLQIAPELGLPIDVPWRNLSEAHRDIVMHGDSAHDFGGLDEFFKWLERRKYQMHFRVFFNRWHSYVTCSDCGGSRLGKFPLAWQLAGRTLADVCRMTIEDAGDWFRSLEIDADLRRVAAGLLQEIEGRLGYLGEVGLGYLALERPLRTLSRGEAQRVALTTALGSTLVQMLYVLDEPTSGMHPHDVARLSNCISRLRDRGNTVICVEHDESMIRSAQHLVEVGPGAGDHGGRITFQGTGSEMLDSEESVTAPFLTGQRGFLSEQNRRATRHGWIKLVGARGNNLKNLTIEFPLGVLCLVTGVSGAGKSSLVRETLYGAICKRKRKECDRPLAYDDLLGDGQIDDVVLVDQSPIGRSPRSNPVTYVKAFDEIRNVFATTVEARTRNFSASHFSFNVEGGRCERCKGDGMLSIDMQFMADVFVKCPECQGRRYRKEILDVKLRGKSIADVLEMSVRQAFSFFRGQTKVQLRLKPLMDVGLDYLKLGQSATTLSSGEAQRLKLASYTSQLKRNRMLFILEEPTAGLHFADVVQLLDTFDALINVGHSMIVVDHNPRLMRAADYLIDIGPGAGVHGGSVVVAGTPEEVAACDESLTGRQLKQWLAHQKQQQEASS